MRLIDADALIKNIKGYSQIEGTKLSKADEKIIECFISHVEMLEPTVEAKEVVHAKWVDTQPGYHNGFYRNAHVCSNCNDYYTTEPEELFFCPRCAADMRTSAE